MNELGGRFAESARQLPRLAHPPELRWIASDPTEPPAMRTAIERVAIATANLRRRLWEFAGAHGQTRVTVIVAGQVTLQAGSLPLGMPSVVVSLNLFSV